MAEKKPVARRKRADGEQSRERILDAAAEIAAERGYEGTSIGAVSAKCGLPASSIYWHFKDKVLLVGSALVVCVVGGGAFWIAEDYHVKPAWVFFAWNSILMAPLFLRDFRTHLRKPFFVIYLAAWAAVHGLLIVGLMRWVPLGYWLICILIEGTIGLVLADYLFGIRPTTERP